LVVLQDYRKYKHRESLETQIHLTFDEALEFYKKNKITKILVGKLGQFAGNYEVNKSLVASAMDALEISLITGESKLVHLPLGMTKSVCIFLDECKKQGLVVEGTYQNQKLISFKTLVFIGALIVVTATIVFVANH
jgi:hypothetical protein